ncbi:unnamed protein product, partial [Symbiodinium sp. CCMP2456]
DIPRDERKRQYAALRRAILKNANPALSAKFSLCDDESRFGMLKSFLVNQGVGSIEVEEKYSRWVTELRTDRYVTIFQLEKIYGKGAEAKAFIEALIKGQVGTPHPQVPDSPKAKMYKVLREVVQEHTTGSKAATKLKLGGRVNEASAKKILAKQLGEFANNLESAGFLDLKTGRISGKTLCRRSSFSPVQVNDPVLLSHYTTFKESQEAPDRGEASREGSEECYHKVPRLQARCSILEYCGNPYRLVLFLPRKDADVLYTILIRKEYITITYIYIYIFYIIGNIYIYIERDRERVFHCF